MLQVVRPEIGAEVLVTVGPTREAIVSWNTRSLEGALDLRVNAQDGRTSAWLPYAQFDANGRRSACGRDTFVHIDTDVVRSDVDLVTIGIRSSGPLDALFVSTPDYGAPSPIVALPAVTLDVPAFSQYEPRYPAERGWCSAAALAMLLTYHDYPVDVPVVAREVFDGRYGGTGNWSFNVAFAGTLGFRAAVVHLRDLAHAHAFLADDVPARAVAALGRRRVAGRTAATERRPHRRPARHRRKRRCARQRSRRARPLPCATSAQRSNGPGSVMGESRTPSFPHRAKARSCSLANA